MRRKNTKTARIWAIAAFDGIFLRGFFWTGFQDFQDEQDFFPSLESIHERKEILFILKSCPEKSCPEKSRQKNVVPHRLTM